MSRRGVIVLAVLVLLGGGAGALAYALGWLRLAGEPIPAAQRSEPSRALDRAVAKASEAVSSLIGDNSPSGRVESSPRGSRAPFDVARINPDGTSVIAGRAAPNARLTLLADGEPIASASADDSGEWVVVTDHKFKSRDPALTVADAASVPVPRRDPTPTASAVSGDPARAATARPARDAADAAAQGTAREAPPSPGVRAVTSQLMADLEQLVAAARKEREAAAFGTGRLAELAPAQEPAADADPSSTETATAASRVSPEAAGEATSVRAAAAPAVGGADGRAGDRAAGRPALPSVSIPIPVLFHYNEATFTDEGRKAAGLLLEYLQVKGLRVATLTGHADERGSPGFNMELSAQRLEAMRAYLESGGYTGRLVLEAKGEAEPFSGVDRERFSRDELFQLDRRVELRLDR